MARDGYRIFDSDTHVGPDAGILSAYLSTVAKDQSEPIWLSWRGEDHAAVSFAAVGRCVRADPQSC